MVKHDGSFKLGIVKAYLNGEGSYLELAKKWGMLDSKSLRNWVRIYETVGKAGIQRKGSSVNSKFIDFSITFL